ncbi:response regulator transcription factor [Acetanaerobacterium elongatum]|uniref:Stage 0 sporulation protein A homolog n=1 Tax=Acetanaerobacterium elongatum TaxID=258515 RepID=A0A1G9V0G8_9FIRM|nr:response regulator transcription factor [Acetanaerobacterium elongatum]SDM65712.1 DNA-binding response regulator, OmpR family, contains REC and winged-helix (wHTH) domain [Acetanaerobacterium elongatum]
MKRILVVEDEDVIRDFVVINLQRAGYDVTDVNCGEAALKAFDDNRGDFDVVLLDVMMPGIDGFTVCKRLRQKSNSVGIIMLTAKTQEMDKVGGLMIGADDYVTKPFSPSELVARVDAIYRRVTMAKGAAAVPATEELRSGVFVLNLRSRTLTKNGTPVELTQVEFQIMDYFMKNPDVAIERNEILTKIWGEHYCGDVKIVDVNIRRLRMKIEDEPSTPKHILTVWGYGYKWNA